MPFAMPLCAISQTRQKQHEHARKCLRVAASSAKSMAAPSGRSPSSAAQGRSRAVKHRRLSALRQASVSGVARTAEPCGASRMTVTCAPDTLPRSERNPGSRGAGRPRIADPVQRLCRGFVRRIEGIRKRMFAFEDEAVARILAPHDRERCRPASLGGTGPSRDPVDARARQAVLQGDAAQALAGNHRRDNLSVAVRRCAH